MSMSKKILILAANPKNTTRLRLDEEVREIKESLRRSKKRGQFEDEQKEAVRIRDLSRALLDCEPQIVHFSGHGEVSGIMLEDETGKAVKVPAEAINKHIKYVIGMRKEIGDQAAIEFAIGFYDALGAGKTIEKAFYFGRSAIQLKDIPEDLTPILKNNPGISSQIGQPRIFISYKRDVNPDVSVATEVSKKLEELGYYVFIDQIMTSGTEWVKRIDEEISNADFLIPFLSEQAIQSEMVRAEIEKAHHSKAKCGWPVTLPVRLNYRAPFQYPISEYLNPINWATWDKSEDTPRLIDELTRAISGKPLPISPETQGNIIEQGKAPEIHIPTYSAQPKILEMPEGTIDPESKFYIERPGDQVALKAIKELGVTITIKAPRQMGKSSLLMRIIQAAQKSNKRVVFLDFQQFDKPALEDADTFYTQFCSWLTVELDLEDRVAEYWKMNLSNSMRCTRYLQRYLLKQVNSPLVLAMDEVETVFDTNFQSDFFGMLRSWHNQRRTGSIWKNLDLALVTSTEPYQLIENLNQSPFNVGQVINLKDFEAGQLSDLNQRHGSPFNSQQETRLMNLLHGHPYLVRRALYLVASGTISTEELFEQAVADKGPFGDHLRYHLFRVHENEELVKGLQHILEHQACRDDKLFRRLEGAGLVQREGSRIVPRCELYAKYFKARLHG